MYRHIISLGFFCGTASELDRIGIRDFSGPFDWVISANFKHVLELIENNFEDFLNEDYLKQLRAYPDYYVNYKYQVSFYHDFNRYKSCKEQLENIKKKYDKRIIEFYKNIKNPTLFIRYINTQQEYDYIENNIDKITHKLKRYNLFNEIIFIANDHIKIDDTKLTIFLVKPDINDSVARNFLDRNKELSEYLNSNIYEEEKRKKNIKIYRRKQLKKKLLKRPKKIIKDVKTRFFKIKWCKNIE